MKELEMIKAFAELEGVFIEYKLGRYYFTDNGYELKEYNPITEPALTFKAMLDYDVQKTTKTYSDGVKLNTIHIGGHNIINALYDSEVQFGVIQCILKSKGRWVE